MEMGRSETYLKTQKEFNIPLHIYQVSSKISHSKQSIVLVLTTKQQPNNTQNIK